MSTRKPTKREIYNKYGITAKTVKGRIYILAPWNEYINPLLPIGSNDKVGKAATWSMTHGNETINIDTVSDQMKSVFERLNIREIVASCPCHCKGCYCDHGCYSFFNNKMLNLMKLVIARYYIDFMQAAIIAQIAADHITQVRIHASGDFFSPEYVNAWKAICIACKGTIFWTYTKYEYALNAFEHIDNLSIVQSITPAGINFGTCSQLLKTYKQLVSMGYRVHICACGTDREIHCSDCKTGCKAIGKECDFTLFIEHSTEYKAGKDDPDEFMEIYRIICHQNN